MKKKKQGETRGAKGEVLSLSPPINIGTKTGDVGKFFFFRWHLAKATTNKIIIN